MVYLLNVATMGNTGEFYNELNKLKKELLIEIILNRSVPTGVVVSKELRKLIEVERVQVFNVDDDKKEHNLNMDICIVQLKSDVKVLETKLQCTRTVMSAMEKTISDKEEIINLLRKQGGNSFVLQKKNHVADRTEKLQDENNQISLKKFVEHRKPIVEATQQRTTDRSSVPERPNRERTNVIIGNCEKSGDAGKSTFACAVRRAWLYVGRAEVGTSPQQVQSHLCGCFPGHNFDVEALPVRDDAKSVAFRVGADITLIDELRKPEMWPTGILVKRYRFFRRLPQESE